MFRIAQMDNLQLFWRFWWLDALDGNFGWCSGDIELIFEFILNFHWNGIVETDLRGSYDHGKFYSYWE